MSELVVQGVTKEFPTRGEPLVVLSGIDLRLESGENLAIVGPSGSGKSTLLQIIGTLDSPTSGHVQLDGVDPFQLGESQLAAYRNDNVGFVFQDHHLLPQLSVLENVLIPCLARGTPTPELRARAEDLIERVGLADRRHHRPAELSGGERERAAVARALVLSPKILLADEPTGNLDRANAERISDLLLALQQKEATMLVVVTHSLELAERLQRCLVLTDGKLAPREVAAS